MSTWPIGQLSSASGGQMPISISAIQLFRVFMMANRYPVGQPSDSSLWAANFSIVALWWGEQRKLWWELTTDGRLLRSSKNFSIRLKKEARIWGSNWMLYWISQDAAQGNTCQSWGISDQSIWTKRRLKQHHASQWCQNFPSCYICLFQHGPRNESQREEGTHKNEPII